MLFCIWGNASAQANTQDSTLAKADSVRIADSFAGIARAGLANAAAARLYGESRYLNYAQPAIKRVEYPKRKTDTNYLFFVLGTLAFLIALLRNSDRKHFSTLFRVLFNTSIRQSQLVEQLRQARQTRFFYTMLAYLILGLALYFLFFYTGFLSGATPKKALLACMAFIFILYGGKSLFMHFAGWLTNKSREISYYLFNISLVNITLSILLLPLLFFIAFSGGEVSKAFVVIAVIVVAVLLSLRFIKSWSLVQHSFRFNILQFIFCFFSLEVLPVVLIVKALSLYLK